MHTQHVCIEQCFLLRSTSQSAAQCSICSSKRVFSSHQEASWPYDRLLVSHHPRRVLTLRAEKYEVHDYFTAKRGKSQIDKHFSAGACKYASPPIQHLSPATASRERPRG